MPMIMGGIALLAAGGLAGTLVSGIAAEARPSSLDSTAVAASLAQRLPKTKISHVDCKKLTGICEITAGANLFYTDALARYLVIGRVYDMATRQDLTAARLLELSPDVLVSSSARAEEQSVDTGPAPQRPAASLRVNLAELPKSGAIRWGGQGAARLVVFSDFHCAYCRQLSTELRSLGVTVDERPISVLGTRKLSEAVYCARNPPAALHAAYRGVELAASSPCDTSGLDANEAFARKHGFNGTPVVVRASDGAVLEGYRPAAVLAAWLKGGAA